VEPDSSLMRTLIAGFEQEARELVDLVTQNLLSIEKGGLDRAALSNGFDKVCRALHTLKGSAATCGLSDVSQLSHRLEDLVAPFRSGNGQIPSERVDLILTGMDALLGRIHWHAKPDHSAALDPGEWNELVAQMESAQGSPVVLPSVAGPQEKREGEVPGAPEESAERSDLEGGWKVDAPQVIRMMQEVERLREIRLRLSDSSRRLGAALADRKFSKGLTGTADLEGFLFSLQHSLVFNAEETASLVENLESHLKDISMVSFNTIAQPLHRLVRDLSRGFGKQAHLSVVGGELLLDRRVLEGLKGPLVHLVRNAMDHGLESPETRDGLGKHREGSLVLRAEQQGNLLYLEVADDGQGVDIEKIRGEAVRRQLFSKEEADRMVEAQLRQLLFHPGFSTKQEVTRVSGRGVGLDVVKSQVAALKGSVEIQSRPGQGTRFMITLPLELGSSPVLLLRAGSHLFGLPMLAAQNIVRAHPEALRISQDHWTLEYEGRSIPLKDLGALLHVRLPKKPQAGKPILILPTGGHELALLVDEVVGDENLVLHPLPPEFENVEAFQGAGLLPSGELMLVLRTGWFSKLEEHRDPFKDKLKILVVDDSLTARAMHRNMLESAGYLVHGASSARQGLELIESSTYDVVLCDIGMEEMDGLDFTRRLRADLKTRLLPVILVSARDEEKNIEGYLQQGADAFLSKRDCTSGRLLSEVSKVLESRRKKA
jgi:two-component system, chemotaxis family, sensor kinase CheA